jgi:hypothetical protein
MPEKLVQIDCPVEFQTGVSPFGNFANAFRVVLEAGDECFLDFCVYLAQENRAQVVARVRVNRSFLAIIQARLGAELVNLSHLKPGARVEAGNVLRLDGKLVLFKPPEGEQ